MELEDVRRVLAEAEGARNELKMGEWFLTFAQWIIDRQDAANGELVRVSDFYETNLPGLEDPWADIQSLEEEDLIVVEEREDLNEGVDGVFVGITPDGRQLMAALRDSVSDAREALEKVPQ